MSVSRRLAITVVMAAASALVLAVVFIQDFAPGDARDAPDAPEAAASSPTGLERVRGLNRQANALAARGRDEEALKLLARALEIDPGCAPAHYNRGRIHHRRGDYATALGEYDNALEIRPDYAKVLTNRAILLARPGVTGGAARTEQALADLTRAIELAPERTPAYYHRARIALALGRHGPARADLDRLLELDPSDRKAWLLRSRARRALGDAAGAENDLPRARRVEEARSE